MSVYARVLAVALMTGAIAAAVSVPALVSQGRDRPEAITAPPSSHRRTLRLPALRAPARHTVVVHAAAPRLQPAALITVRSGGGRDASVGPLHTVPPRSSPAKPAAPPPASSPAAPPSPAPVPPPPPAPDPTREVAVQEAPTPVGAAPAPQASGDSCPPPASDEEDGHGHGHADGHDKQHGNDPSNDASSGDDQGHAYGHDE
jgi:hypothetical protein